MPLRLRRATDQFPRVRWEPSNEHLVIIAVVEGEVVACKEDGTPDFRALHSGNYAQEILCVWAFDLMELNGEDLRPFSPGVSIGAEN